jgi:ADP-ribosylglycohydrolase
MERKERLAGCIIGGAIGDAWGSAYENALPKINPNTFYLGKVEEVQPTWSFTDDTQFTLITLEALLNTDNLTPEVLANQFVRYYKRKKITGIGASTLKALQELEAGGHWSQVGRSGEYAAGNGAAMRVAPFAFYEGYTRDDIRSFCRITHRNDEAYVGALAIVLSIQQILNGNWNGEGSLIELIIPHLPDTRVRDRLMDLNKIKGSNVISDAAKFGTDGYVVNSVPFAILCASQVMKAGIETIFKQIIDCGGDTDTNASIAGQIAGALIGEQNIPLALTDKFAAVPGHEWLIETVERAKEKLH